jgi:uncharacterized membrane protein
MDGNQQSADSRPDRVLILLRPNRSLSRRGGWLVFGVIAGFLTIITVGFALLGAWMILPFAGLEVVLVGVVTAWFARHHDDREWIVLEPTRVRIARREGKRQEQFEFQRYWARVRFERRRRRSAPSRLSIGSHGRFVEIGSQIGEVTRQVLARELKGALRAGHGSGHV